MNIGELTATLGIDTSDLEKAEKRMQEFGKKATLYLTTPLVIAGGYAFKMASDVAESMNKVDVAFGKDAAKVQEWSKTTLNALGLSKNASLDMVALYGDMSTSMGFTTSAAADMSINMVKLAADMASYKNIQIDVAQTALAGVFTGETESLKKLGIVMTEANLQQYAYSQGVRKKIEDLTQSEKVLLRYNYILSVTKNSQGDFERTSDSAANQMRTFQESIKETSASLGEELVPVITPMIQELNKMIKSFGELTPAQKQWILGTAAAVAAIGPLSMGIGGLVSIGGKAVDTFKLLNSVISKNPYILAIAGVVTLVAAIAKLSKEQDKVNEGFAEFTSELSAQRLSMNSLFEVAKSDTADKSVKAAAIKTLNEQYGQYLPYLITEKTTVAELNIAQENANNALIRSIALKSQQKDIDAVFLEYTKEQKNASQDLIEEITKKRGSNFAAVAQADVLSLIKNMNELKKAGQAADAEMSMMKFIDKYRLQNNSLVGKAAFTESDAAESINDMVEAYAKQEDAIKRINEFYNALIGTLGEVKTKQDAITTNPLSLSGIGGGGASDAQYKLLNEFNPYAAGIKMPKMDKLFDKPYDYSKSILLAISNVTSLDTKLQQVADHTRVFNAGMKESEMVVAINKNQIAFLSSEMQKLWDNGFRPGDKEFDRLNEKFKELSVQSKDFYQELMSIGDALKILGGISDNELGKTITSLGNLTMGATEAGFGMSKLVAGDITALPQVVSGIAESIEGLKGLLTQNMVDPWIEISERTNEAVSRIGTYISLMKSMANTGTETFAADMEESKLRQTALENYINELTKLGQVSEKNIFGSTSLKATNISTAMGMSKEQMDVLKGSGIGENWSGKNINGSWYASFTQEDLDKMVQLYKQEGMIFDKGLSEKIQKYMELKAAAEETNKVIAQAENEAFINTQINNIQKRILWTEKGSKDELKLKQELLDTQWQLDAASITKSVQNEQERISKLDLVYEQYMADRRGLEQEYEQQRIEDAKKYAEERQRALESLFGTTSSTLADSIKKGLEDGLSYYEAFGDTIETLLRQGLINGLSTKAIQPYMDSLMKYAGDLMSGGLTKDELGLIKKNYGEGSLAGNMLKQSYEGVQSVLNELGLNAGGTETKSKKGTMTGAIEGIQENTAELIAGQLNGVRLSAIKIEENTRVLLEIRDMLKTNPNALQESNRVLGFN